MLKLPTHHRYDYSSIEKRRDFNWPDGKRLAFYVALNVEQFAFMTGRGADPTQRGGPQTQRNFAWREYGRWRAGLSNCTVPVFFASVPGGNSEFSSARFTTGPLTRNGLVGRRPADGPGSTWVADGQIGAVAGPQSWAMNESENTPAETTPVTKVNGVF